MSTGAGGVSVLPPTLLNDMSIQLFVASRGNHCMIEIAQLFHEGFLAIGVKSEIVFDGTPNPEDKQLYPIVVAPHEYLPLCLQPRYDPEECHRIISQCYVITTEQPGSSWFDESCTAALEARGVFDINEQGTAVLQELGFMATHTPLGIGQPFLKHAEHAEPENRVDVVFFGHSSPRRDRFLATHADMFHQLDCRLIMAPLDQPRTEDSSMVMTGSRRNALLRSSKILINVHSYERRYFEWHRALSAIANRCLLISETSESTDPLLPGKHFASGSIDELGSLINYYLRNDDERIRMTEAAYECVSNSIPITNSCQSIVKQLQTNPNRATKPSLPAPPVFPGRFSPMRIVRLPVTVPRRLSWFATRVATRVSERIEARRRLTRTGRRRTLMVENLRVAEQLRAKEPDADVEFVDNPMFRNAQPAVSVIVTLYNYAECISDCLASVESSELNAIPGGIEILVVDDASTDASADVASRLVSQSQQPMRVVRKKLNTGVADARNVGIRLARGKYVFILDADNLVLPSGIEKLYCALDDVPNPSAYGIVAQFDHSTGVPLSLVSNYAWNIKHLVHTPYIDAMALFDRQALISLGGYSSELLRQGWQGLEDYDLWLRIAAIKGECTFVPNIVARYRVHNRSMICDTTVYREQLFNYFYSRHVDVLREVRPVDWAFGLPLRPASMPK